MSLCVYPNHPNNNLPIPGLMPPQANFDVDKLLNFEKRTGVKNDDIDDFLRKVDGIQNAIQGMKVRRRA